MCVPQLRANAGVGAAGVQAELGCRGRWPRAIWTAWSLPRVPAKLELPMKVCEGYRLMEQPWCSVRAGRVAVEGERKKRLPECHWPRVYKKTSYIRLGT